MPGGVADLHPLRSRATLAIGDANQALALGAAVRSPTGPLMSAQNTDFCSAYHVIAC